MPHKIIIAGGSGFIGNGIIRDLIQKNHEIVVLTRNPDRARETLPKGVNCAKWDAMTGNDWFKQIKDTEVIINLTGENVGSSYWTEKKKQRILESRINSVQAIADALDRSGKKMKLIIQISGISFYGNRGDEILTEAASSGEGFLADVTVKWEKFAKKLKPFTSRLVIFRTSPVLGREGGLAARVVLPFRLFLGGYPGDGKQWISWIHLEDVAGCINFVLSQENVSAVYNLTSPNPTPAKEFFGSICKALHRPCWMHIPATPLKFFLRDMANDVFLPDQRAVPEHLINDGFRFKYPELPDALHQIFSDE
ncbi:MAG: TIGR01777 family oxidoreductase [Calditrichota bacterium]